MLSGPFDLARFVTAQAPVMPRVLEELRAGAKQSHWMWFVFPQLRGLGSSPMAMRYGIVSLAEARAYLADSVLGPRLRDCTALVLAVQGRSLAEILPPPDDMKFCSSMTLFARATDDNALFLAALDTYCIGRDDPKTLQRLANQGQAP